jgi:hypothetical protein
MRCGKWLLVVSVLVAAPAAAPAETPTYYAGSQLAKPMKPAGTKWGRFVGQALRAKLALAKVALTSKQARKIVFANVRQHKVFKDWKGFRTFQNRIVSARASSIRTVLQDASIQLAPKDRAKLDSSLRFWEGLLVPPARAP